MSPWHDDGLFPRDRGPVFRLPLDIRVPKTVIDALRQQRERMRALVVGGSVRDAILGLDPQDIDIEVYGISYDELGAVLDAHGRTDLVGKAFGVIKFRDRDGNEADFSIPRRESKTGVGHKSFATFFDPGISPQEAAARRDFTINALAWDPLREEIHDYFGGIEDLRANLLRATSRAFAEDPLRVLRGMQFRARYGMRLDPETARLCRSLRDEYRHLALERVAAEWMKLATRGTLPGLAFEHLIETGWIELYPPLARLVGVPQDPEWHPEGAVDVHVAHVMNAMARIADREGVAGDDRAVLIFAALTHDLAKSYVHDGGTTMLRQKGGRQRWTAHGHEEAGGPMAREFLGALGIKASIIARVVPLVENHLQHLRIGSGEWSSPAGVRQLADRLAPATIRELALLIEADQGGRPPLPGGLPPQALRMLELAQQESLTDAPPPRLVQGRHVLPYYGGHGGPHIGEATGAAYGAYLKGAFTTIEQAALWLDDHLQTKVRIVRGEDVLPYFGTPGPHIGTVVRAAWKAQVAGEFTDHRQAMAWLERYLAANPLRPG